MRFFCEPRTGAPFVDVPTPAGTFQLSMFPLLKLQLEMYLAEPIGFGDDWYDTVLAASPRGSLGRANATWESLLATALLPSEAGGVLRWLGPDYGLPTLEQWRAALETLERQPFSQAAVEDAGWSRLWRQVLERFLAVARPSTWVDAVGLGRTEEWVVVNNGREPCRLVSRAKGSTVKPRMRLPEVLDPEIRRATRSIRVVRCVGRWAGAP